jgi:adenine-specific DNA-methyltransferase
MCHTTEKWTQYFLERDDILLLRELRQHPRLTRAGTLFDVDVGIVTGLNAFFVLNAQQMHDHALPTAYTQPLVGRSGHLPGIIFSEDDWQGGVAKQHPAYLLTLPHDVPLEQLPPPLQAYIRSGEERQFHTGYKCRIRTPWYCVPSIWTPDAFLLRQVHSYPRLILNSAGATCTDTIHRVRFRNGTKGSIIAAAFLNSLTFAFAEVTGRSYGGGVLELEPREAEVLPLPLAGAETLDLKQLHQQIRVGAIEAVLDQTDHVLLVEGLGLSTDQTARLRTIWRTLSERRIGRR